MSLIAAVGRKSLKNRILIVLIYSALTLLGATMVLPFLITITGSASSDSDYERFSPIPRYLWSRSDRFVKCLSPYFNYCRNWTQQMNAYVPQMPGHWSTWSMIGRDVEGADRLADGYLAAYRGATEQHRLIAADYAEFTAGYPLSDCVTYLSTIDTVKWLQKTYGEKLLKTFPERAARMSRKERRHAALAMVGEEWGVPFDSFYTIGFQMEMGYPMDFQSWFPPLEDEKYRAYSQLKQAYAAHAFTPGIKSKWLKFLKAENMDIRSVDDVFPVADGASPELKALWLEFKKQVAPAAPTIPFSMRAVWLAFLRSEDVGLRLKIPTEQSFDVARYNQLAGTSYQTLYDTPFPVPESLPPAIQRLWDAFRLERYPLRLVTVVPTPELQAKYQTFIERAVKHLRIANELLGTDHTSWNEFPLTDRPAGGTSMTQRNRRDLWKNFVKTLAVEDNLYASSEMAYQRFLLERYGSLQEINARYGWTLGCIEEAYPPVMTAYTVTFLNNERRMTFGPIWENYRTVIDFLLFKGNALWVTTVLVVLTILFTLTVNPLAAYALSRFNLRGQDKILVFLLATMAFPAMVSAIPAYLLMRDLNLLNTFWALVIPGAANGMSIFILKGFFDSLPMDLFEAATIDGATEMHIFRVVAMPLVKPILAINSLTAFIVAYNGWQWALIICQDKSMWTIAVWLYQASSWWGNFPWIVSAGFVVASIPTLVLFISCQKIILRGIIIPSMK